jgi:hypothetical protein
VRQLNPCSICWDAICVEVVGAVRSVGANKKLPKTRPDANRRPANAAMVYSPEYVVDRLLIPLNQATTARSAEARAQYIRLVATFGDNPHAIPKSSDASLGSNDERLSLLQESFVCSLHLLEGRKSCSFR